jgi:hypothetical protein
MTDTETILENSDLKPRWWIKFNSDTGRILRITPREIRDSNDAVLKIIKTDSEICSEILGGKLSLKSCGMIWDIETAEWSIEKRTNNLVLRNLSGQLFQIRGTDPVKSDISLNIYKDTNTLEVKVNLSIIKQTMNLMDIETVSRTEDALLNLYFTKLNDPDYLIAIAEIDPMLLFKKRSVLIHLDEVAKYADWNNISIFTRPIFRKYSLEISDKRVETAFTQDKRNILQTVITKEKTDAHLYIVPHKEKLKILSEVQKDQDYVYESKKTLQFLVFNSNIDELVGGFTVNIDELKINNTLTVDIPFRMPRDPLILYKNKYLSVNYLGDNNG